MEARDQLVGELTDEADGIGEQHHAASRKAPRPRARVERREQSVLSHDASVGQPIHERRLASVRVADQGDREALGTAADLARLATADVLELVAQRRDSPAQLAAVEGQLLFAGAAAVTDTSTLAFEVGPHPLESRQLVLKAGELDLQLRLLSAGVELEDVQDQLATVEDRYPDRPLDAQPLGRRQRIIDDHHFSFHQWLLVLLFE